MRKRAERAQLLGFASHADFVLADEMAGSPQKAMELIKRVATPAANTAAREVRTTACMHECEQACLFACVRVRVRVFASAWER